MSLKSRFLKISAVATLASFSLNAAFGSIEAPDSFHLAVQKLQNTGNATSILSNQLAASKSLSRSELRSARHPRAHFVNEMDEMLLALKELGSGVLLLMYDKGDYVLKVKYFYEAALLEKAEPARVDGIQLNQAQAAQWIEWIKDEANIRDGQVAGELDWSVNDEMLRFQVYVVRNPNELDTIKIYPISGRSELRINLNWEADAAKIGRELRELEEWLAANKTNENLVATLGQMVNAIKSIRDLLRFAPRNVWQMKKFEELTTRYEEVILNAIKTMNDRTLLVWLIGLAVEIKINPKKIEEVVRGRKEKNFLNFAWRHFVFETHANQIMSVGVNTASHLALFLVPILMLIVFFVLVEWWIATPFAVLTVYNLYELAKSFLKTYQYQFDSWNELIDNWAEVLSAPENGGEARSELREISVISSRIGWDELITLYVSTVSESLSRYWEDVRIRSDVQAALRSENPESLLKALRFYEWDNVGSGILFSPLIPVFYFSTSVMILSMSATNLGAWLALGTVSGFYVLVRWTLHEFWKENQNIRAIRLFILGWESNAFARSELRNNDKKIAIHYGPTWASRIAFARARIDHIKKSGVSGILTADFWPFGGPVRQALSQFPIIFGPALGLAFSIVLKGGRQANISYLANNLSGKRLLEVAAHEKAHHAQHKSFFTDKSPVKNEIFRRMISEGVNQFVTRYFIHKNRELLTEELADLEEFEDGVMSERNIIYPFETRLMEKIAAHVGGDAIVQFHRTGDWSLLAQSDFFHPDRLHELEQLIVGLSIILRPDGAASKSLKNEKPVNHEADPETIELWEKQLERMKAVDTVFGALNFLSGFGKEPTKEMKRILDAVDKIDGLPKADKTVILEPEFDDRKPQLYEDVVALLTMFEPLIDEYLFGDDDVDFAALRRKVEISALYARVSTARNQSTYSGKIFGLNERNLATAINIFLKNSLRSLSPHYHLISVIAQKDYERAVQWIWNDPALKALKENIIHFNSNISHLDEPVLLEVLQITIELHVNLNELGVSSQLQLQPVASSEAAATESSSRSELRNPQRLQDKSTGRSQTSESLHFIRPMKGLPPVNDLLKILEDEKAQLFTNVQIGDLLYVFLIEEAADKREYVIKVREGHQFTQREEFEISSKSSLGIHYLEGSGILEDAYEAGLDFDDVLHMGIDPNARHTVLIGAHHADSHQTLLEETLHVLEAVGHKSQSIEEVVNDLFQILFMPYQDLPKFRSSYTNWNRVERSALWNCYTNHGTLNPNFHLSEIIKKIQDDVENFATIRIGNSDFNIAYLLLRRMIKRYADFFGRVTFKRYVETEGKDYFERLTQSGRFKSYIPLFPNWNFSQVNGRFARPVVRKAARRSELRKNLFSDLNPRAGIEPFMSSLNDLVGRTARELLEHPFDFYVRNSFQETDALILMNNLTKSGGSATPVLARKLTELGKYVVIVAEPIVRDAMIEADKILGASDRIRIVSTPEEALEFLNDPQHKITRRSVVALKGSADEENARNLLIRGLADEQVVVESFDELLSFSGFVRSLVEEFHAIYETMIAA